MSGCAKKSLVDKLSEENFFESINKNKVRVRVIAPASGMPLANLNNLHEVLKGKIEFDTTIMDGSSVFHSKKDKLRIEDFIEAINSENNVLWALRGGYGSGKLIDYLYKVKKPKTKKIIVGYSDITALHIFLSQEWDWESIHGAMVAEINNDTKDISNFRALDSILKGGVSSISLNKLNRFKQKDEVSNKIIGGNIDIIQNSIGTKWQIKTAGKILFLEDLGYKGYQLDRVLNHFREAGLFNEVKAVIFGNFYQPKDEYIKYAIELFLEKANFPVYETQLIGHGKHNLPIVINSQARISRKMGNKYVLSTQLS
jgi:muramoyltetrapeptide carboxypeptidase